MNNNFNFNNEAANNSNNDFNGGIVMMNGTIKTMDVFATTVKVAVEESLGAGYSVEIHEVLKNNDTRLTGLTIRGGESNVAPTIYLDGFFAKYKEGMSMTVICNNIIETYEAHKVNCNFDASSVTDFERAKNQICYKLINADRNRDLLADAPHKIVCDDLAVIFYILVSQDFEGTASITIRNNMMNIWGVNADTLFALALDNTQRLFRGSVKSMASVMMDMFSERLDDEDAKEFYDMVVSEEDMIPMYVCTNVAKVNGAGVILYKDLLKEFADRTGADFYILPSSIHETLLIPVADNMELDYLASMVREVNASEVAPEEQLSDNVYIYRRATDSIELA